MEDGDQIKSKGISSITCVFSLTVYQQALIGMGYEFTSVL
jgi:hypothetical protein